MVKWIILFIVLGAIIGLIANGKQGAATGAGIGLVTIMTILTNIVLPIAIMILFFKACF